MVCIALISLYIFIFIEYSYHNTALFQSGSVQWWLSRIGVLIGVSLLSIIVINYSIEYIENKGISNTLALSIAALILYAYSYYRISKNQQQYRSTLRDIVLREVKDAKDTINESNRKIEELAKQQRINDEALSSIDSQREELYKIKIDLEEKESYLDLKESEIDIAIISKANEIEIGLQSQYDIRMSDFMTATKSKMEKRFIEEKEKFITDIFSYDATVRDDFYEIKQAKESLHKEKEQIEKSKFLQEVEEKVSKANEHVISAKSAALDIKSENVDLWSEIKALTNDFKLDLTKEKAEREQTINIVIHKLELEQEKRKSETKEILAKLTVMEAENKSRMAEIKSSFSIALKELESKTVKLFSDVKDNMSQIKLKFGKEILRLDGQQAKILTELERYYVKNEQFVNQCKTLALEARQSTIEGNNLLNQVNLLYSQHKLDADKIEARLSNSLDKISVVEGKLANTIGQAMLELKSISDEHYFSMKDLSLEKKDIDLIWREKNNEHELNLQELQHHQYKLDNTRELIRSDNQNSSLRHKMFMEEQKHVMAMNRVLNSGSYLNSWRQK